MRHKIIKQKNFHNSNNVNWIYTIIIKNTNVLKLQKYLDKKKIETRPIFFLLSENKIYKKYYKSRMSSKNAKFIHKYGISLPTYYGLKNKEIKYICDQIIKFLNDPYKKIYIIAEAGVNHNGSLNLAKKLILTAKKCGADAVKFQIFNKREQISDIAPTAPYQNKNTKKKSMLKMADKYDFKWENHIILKKLCDKIGIDYMASCFDKTSVDFYKNILKVKTLKIASSEIDNLRLLKYVNEKFKKVILSTGMSNVNEISRGIKCLNKVDKLYLMQCTSLYPTELNEAIFECAC